MNDYQVYLKRVGQIGIFLLFIWVVYTVGKDWIKPSLIKALGGFTAKEVKTTIDTISVRRDTIFVSNWQAPDVDTIVKPNKVKYTQLASSLKGKISHNFKNIDTSATVYTYENAINDSLLEAKINTVINLSDCKIVAQSLNYKPKFPIIVTEYKTITKTIDNTLYDKPKAKIGAGITGTSASYIGGTLIYQTPNNIQYQAGYLLNTGNLVPSETNKGVISISIIKLF